MSISRTRFWLALDEPDDEPLSPWVRFDLLRAACAQEIPEAAALPETAWSAQLLAELTNYLAKAVDERWYAEKAAAFVLARELGCGGGWGPDGCFYLSTPEAGVCCAHDPWGQIADLAPLGSDLGGSWPHPWSRVSRQPLAADLVCSASLRRWMAAATDPAGSVDHPSVLRALGIDEPFGLGPGVLP